MGHISQADPLLDSTQKIEEGRGWLWLWDETSN